jgi:hypothetical protein
MSILMVNAAVVSPDRICSMVRYATLLRRIKIVEVHAAAVAAA